ncbi:MAG: LLM class flavin-dependent oxidoreductase [Acidobacteriaceae bacterium]
MFMKFGFQLPTGMEGLIVPIPFFCPEDFIEMAIAAERLGYNSLWGNDHYATQNYVREKWGANPNFYEVLITLSVAAAVTHTIQLGTSILVLPMRDVVLLARQVATLDQLSHGRLILGVGIGAYKEEYEAARPSWAKKNRGEILEEGLELLNHLFTGDEITFKGKFYQVNSFALNPRPLQSPFPILVGGHQKFGIDRAIRYGQGWIPGWRPFDELREWIILMKEKASQVGQDPASLIIAPQFSCLVGSTQEEAIRKYQQTGMVKHRASLAYTGRDPALAMENNFIGCPEDILEKIERLESYGVNHLSAITFCAQSVNEFKEQVHFFAQEVMEPYRHTHESSNETSHG